MRNVAVLIYVMKQTGGDAIAVSLISVAEYAPIFIFSFIGGTYADRWRPKRTMICCDILSALSVFIVLITFYIGTWKVIFCVTLVSAILSQFSQPCGLKLFKYHLSNDEMQTAIAIYQMIGAVFLILGPVLGMIVFQAFGIGMSIAVMGIAFLLSAASLMFLPPDRAFNGEKTRETFIGELANGVRYILSRKELKLLGLCFMAIGFGLGLIQPLGIFLVTERLCLTIECIQWFMAVGGIGLITGGVLSIVVSRTIRPQRLLIFGLILSSVSIAVAGLSTMLWLTLTVHFLGSLVIPIITIGVNTLIMHNTEEAYVGRVNGILSPMYTGSMLVTMCLAGILKHIFTLVGMYGASALLFICGIIITMPLYYAKEL